MSKETQTPEQKEAAAAEKAAAEQAKAELEATKKAFAEQAKAKKEPYTQLAEQYAKSYPENKVFHITTDKQVFLSNNLSAAQNHQKTIGDGKGSVTTINL